MTSALPASVTRFNDLPDDARVDVQAVAVLFGRSVNSIWRDVKSGRVPQPHKHGRSTRWRVGDIRAALAAA
jgi:predicted DNA-binding transcriptional regulator AlpA